MTSDNINCLNSLCSFSLNLLPVLLVANMLISAFLLLAYFQDFGMEISTAGVDATDTCLLEREFMTESSHPSFEALFDNTVTNDSIINIPSTIMLSKTVELKNYKNITIIGESVVTVTGSLMFESCNGISIEGIIWERCGTDHDSFTNPSLEFYDSSNILIQNCTFTHLKGQAIVLSEVSGNVFINNSQFTHNNEYMGHGTAMHISQSKNHGQLNVTIDNCNFTLNGPAESVVYINGLQSYNDVIVKNSAFIKNQGVPIYVAYANLHLNDTVLFEQTKARAGGGIYSISSMVFFNDKSNVTFYRNSVQTDGGCIFLDHSSIFIIGNSAVKFTENNAVRDGGAVYSDTNTTISVKENSTVIFSNNKAASRGGALFWRASFDSNTSTTNNSAEYKGVAHTSHNSVMLFHGNSSVIFMDNSCTEGGALYFENGSGALFNGSTSVTFTNNNAEVGGF